MILCSKGKDEMWNEKIDLQIIQPRAAGES